MVASCLSVIGLGKLGSCLAASLAANGFDVTGADIDDDVVSAIEAGTAPYSEPRLQEYLDETRSLSATTSVETAVENSDVSFVVVNTPSTADDRYSLEYVESVCAEIGETLRDTDRYHLVVLTSTVFPGSTTETVKRVLERTSGKTAGEDFGLCYSPEFIAIGDVIQGLEDPDFYLVGEHTERAGEALAAIYRSLRSTDTPVVRMDPVDAEIVKIAVNSYVTMKISFANSLGQICDGIGGDVDTVTSALAEDGRIAEGYITAGTAYGGPCFPRDNRAFGRLAEDAGTTAPLAGATDAVNEGHTEWLADRVRDVAAGTDSVSILGITYKPGTYIVEESQGIKLADELDGEFEITCYDPMGLDDTHEILGASVRYAESLQAAARHSDCAVITVPWDEFSDTDQYPDGPLTLVDPWRSMAASNLADAIEYVPLGRPRPR